MKWERVGASLRTRPLATLRNTQDLSEPELTLNISYCLERPGHCVALSLLLAFFLNGFETMFTAAIKRSAFSFKPIWNLLGRLARCTIEGFQHRKLHFSTSTQEAERCGLIFCFFLYFLNPLNIFPISRGHKLIFFSVQGGQLPSFLCLSVLIWEHQFFTCTEVKVSTLVRPSFVQSPRQKRELHRFVRGDVMLQQLKLPLVRTNRPSGPRQN